MGNGHSNGAHTDTHTDVHTERSIGAPQDEGILAVLKETISTLQGQLEAKDRQIEQLTSALVAAQQTAATAQALHAGTIQ